MPHVVGFTTWFAMCQVAQGLNHSLIDDYCTLITITHLFLFAHWCGSPIYSFLCLQWTKLTSFLTFGFILFT